MEKITSVIVNGMYLKLYDTSAGIPGYKQKS